MQKWVERYIWWLCFCTINWKCATCNPLQLWEVSAAMKDTTVHKLQNDGLLDIWSGKDGKIQVVVEDGDAYRVKSLLEDAHLTHKVLEKDFLNLVQEEQKFLQEKRRRKRSIEPMDWDSYHRLEDIEGYLGWLNSTSHGRVAIGSVALTQENNHVYVVRVTDPDTRGKKIKVWIEGGIHAREWISPAATTYLMHQVATNPEFGPILAKSTWYFVPVANPDGYQYSFNGGKARMWRKNRSRSNALPFMSNCRGIDLNRNWDLKWGVGASSNPCSETYKGQVPFSEPETEGLRRLMEREGPFDLFITFHSYGQSVLYPWGWTTKPPRNAKDLMKLGRRFVESVKFASKGKTVYNLGGSGDVYGLASGASDDWAYGAIGTPFSYTIELRDTGRHGFLLPENQILETVEETAAGVYCMVSYLANVGRCSRIQRRGGSIESRSFRFPKRRNRVVTFD